jgi:hypothetical protein
MLRDVFYYGDKPNVHPRERHATDLADAKIQCTTEHFWVINEHCNYKDFDWDWDFDFLPDEDVWAEEHNNVWPSPYQKDSGTWLCSTNIDALTVYRADVDPIPLKDEITKNWKIIEYIDKSKFDFKWHPDPSDPPYIYVFGNNWHPGTIMPTVEYHVSGATDRKYITDRLATLLAIPSLFKSIHPTVDFDYSWRPDPTSPPYIYVFGNTQYPASVMPTIEYHVEGATERKYIEHIVPKLASNIEAFELLEDIDTTSFDFSWVPDPTSPPYIYVWGNQWNKPEDKISIQYVVEGATEYKYMDARAKRNPSKNNWKIPDHVADNHFDYSWEPNPNDPPYIYQFGSQWQKTGGPQYIVEGATEFKFVDIKANVVCYQFENWQVPLNIDQSKFDFSWHPDATEQPYIYQFPDQWSRSGGPRFTVEGATEVKYVDAQTATAKVNMTHWIIPEGIDTSDFDFSWHPDIEDKPYVYQFGTQWQKTGGPKFIAYNATLDDEIKYIDATKAKALPTSDSWKTLVLVDAFDYSWHPDTTEEPFIYVFGNQWFDSITEPTVEYHVPGATQRKYITDIIAKTAAVMDQWETLVPVENFDYTWRPHPDSPPYIYVWGNQWNNCFVEPTVQYKVEGATDYQYMENECAYVASTEEENHWEILIPISKFNFSWRPDPSEPPFIYVFGNKWNSAEKEPTVIYRLEGATEYKFVDTLIATPQVNFTNWTIRNSSDRKCFDFSWRPDPSSKAAIYEWGTDGPVYTVPDATETINIEYDTSLREVEEKVIEEPVEIIQKEVSRPMFFVDRGNSESTQRYTELKIRYPQLQKTRYLNSWVETITRCCSKSEKELFWVLNSELDYSEFVFDYNPNPWQLKMIHVFGTQWTHWGNTYLVNATTFPESTKYVKIIEHLPVLNFVKDKRAKATSCLYDIIMIDHGNNDNQSELIKNKTGKDVSVIKYNRSYLQTFKSLLKDIQPKKEHYLWVCSSICDYENFDFSYICDPYAKEQLHVFPSDKQKFGDTFLIDVNKFKSLIDDMIMMEDYEKVNYNQHQRVKRLAPPTIITEDDTLTKAIMQDFSFPYAIFKTSDNKDLDTVDSEPISLWTPDTKNILITSTGGTRLMVPKEAKDYVENELYDYPYISRSKSLAQSQPLDIVFLSNGETGADENYEHLLKVTKGLRNRVVRVDGVNGRVAAYHAAAEASNTPWMFTVFAKLRVNSKFDWSWQPDRLQVPKHYIFHATNPVNNLEYGHQAMIAYNKRITLANSGTGLDFTLDNEHEVVEVNSGVAMYNTDAWTTWRTAFREALKLRADTSQISKDRLHAWLTIGNGNFAEYSTNGAKDAVEYYDEVNGDLAKLRLSYDWPWLKALFDKKTG